MKQIIRMSARVAILVLKHKTLFVHELPANHMTCIWWR